MVINSLKTRAIEFSTLQRAGTHLASLTDIKEAESVGMRAVSAAFSGKTGRMVVMKRKEGKDYKITMSTYDIHNIANVEKTIPSEWIDDKNKLMKDEFINYVKPLIQGELKPIFKDGVVTHLVRK